MRRRKAELRLTADQQRLVAGNLGLVGLAVRRGRRWVQPRGRLAYEDAEAACYEALCRAAALFDPERGVKFSTYAVVTMGRSLIRAAWNDRLIRVPEWNKRHRGPVVYSFFSLYRDEDHHSMDWWDRLADLTPAAPAESPLPDADETPAALAGRLLAVLDERERRVVSERFGLGGQKPRALHAVGEGLGLSKERVRQLQVRAVAKMREAAGGAGGSENTKG